MVKLTTDSQIDGRMAGDGEVHGAAARGERRSSDWLTGRDAPPTALQDVTLGHGDLLTPLPTVLTAVPTGLAVLRCQETVGCTGPRSEDISAHALAI